MRQPCRCLLDSVLVLLMLPESLAVLPREPIESYELAERVQRHALAFARYPPRYSPARHDAREHRAIEKEVTMGGITDEPVHPGGQPEWLSEENRHGNADTGRRHASDVSTRMRQGGRDDHFPFYLFPILSITFLPLFVSQMLVDRKRTKVPARHRRRR